MLPGMLSLIAVALLAAGTPRQAEMLFGRRLDETGRRRLRGAGLFLLTAALSLILASGDIARPLVGWIGLLAIEIVTVALAITAIEAWRRPPRPAQKRRARP